MREKRTRAHPGVPNLTTDGDTPRPESGLSTDASPGASAADFAAEKAKRWTLLAEHGLFRDMTAETVERMPLGFVALDHAMSATYANPMALTLTGASLDALVGRRPWALFPEIVGAQHQTVRTSASLTTEYEEHFAPSDRWAAILACPTATGISIFLRDISGQKRAENTVRSSATLLHGTLDAMLDACMVCSAERDDQGAIVGFRLDFANVVAGTYLGGLPDKLMGVAIPDWKINPSDMPFVDACRRVVETGDPLSVDALAYVMAGPEGQNSPGALGLQVVKFSDGFFATWRDVTEREAARHERERLVAIVDQAPDGIIVTDVSGLRILYANAAFLQDLGRSQPDLAGRNLVEAVDGVLDPATLARLVEVADAGQPWLGEVERRLPDGSVSSLEIRVTPRRAADGAVEDYLVVFRDISERVAGEAALARAHTELAQSLSLLTSILDGTEDHIYAKDLDGRYLLVNRADAAWFGRPQEEIIGRTDADLLDPGEAAAEQQVDRAVLESCTPVTYEQQAARSGVTTTWLTSKDVIRDASGQIVGLFAITREITEQRRQEAQLRQAAKMEAVGQLAGGIAHDFNNMLTAIRGYAELVAQHLSPSDEEDLADLGQVVRAADRAASLTRQLLAFARRQVLEVRLVDPAEVVAGIAPMLQRLLGEHMELVISSASNHGRVELDPAQLEQVILNLAINARDAMPAGGVLTIETGIADLDAAYVAAHPGSSVGPHVLLAVSDTGTGMDQATQAHLFEPFFTTKPAGQGTGMGLATVYGIVKQSAGSIYVYSEPGHGTTFRLYFPRAVGESDGRQQPASPEVIPTGRETILVVEDEPAVREFTARSLANLGYRVIEAGNGVEALAVAAVHPESIDLLVTDLIMPGMHGSVLAERLVAVRPGLRALFVSGFTETSVIQHSVIGDDVAYLPKPFSGEVLGRAVRAVLDGRPLR